MDDDGSDASGNTFAGIDFVAVLDNFVFIFGEKFEKRGDRALIEFGTEGEFLKLFGVGSLSLSSGDIWY